MFQAQHSVQIIIKLVIFNNNNNWLLRLPLERKPTHLHIDWPQTGSEQLNLSLDRVEYKIRLFGKLLVAYSGQKTGEN